jgi:predicted component of type VI protein secretion system
MQVWVRFLSGGRRGETVPLNIPNGGAITVGRADDNHIVLPPAVDVAASSHHCELRNQNNALVLVDTNSTNGTWVYGQRVTTVPLASGIRVTFGRGGPEAEVFFQPDSGAAAPAAPQPARTAPQMAVPAGLAGGPAAAAAAAPPAIPKQGDPCGICGRPLGADMWMCYGCKKGLCASHYDPNARTCVVCSGAVAAPVPSYAQATRPGQPVPAQPYAQPGAPGRAPAPTQAWGAAGAAPAAAGAWGAQPGYGAAPAGGGNGAAVDDGCEICGAQAATSFVCMGCTRCVCETHRDRATGMCEQCARSAGAQQGGYPAQSGYR